MKVSSTRTSFGEEKFRETRPLDYIYDPVFTFSGPKQFNRTAHESYQSSSEYNVQPIFDSMFSDMVRYPRANLLLRPSHHVASSMDTSYKGKVKATSQERTVTAEVTGVDRYKYFRRPVSEQPGLSTGPGTATGSRALLGLDSVTHLGILAPPTTAEKSRERSSHLSATTQVRGVQTDYRENETQTQPWTPPYMAKGQDTPELLRLDRMRWGSGLPPGKHEVDIIERMRMKEAWESQLPPLDTRENIGTRFKLIEDMEKSDWKFRDEEIQTIHNERLKRSEKLLEQHNLMNRTRLSYRMEFLEDDINKRKEVKLQLARRDKARALRKLCMKEKGYNPKYQKKGILEENLQHTSQLYAPMKQFGKSFKNRHEVLAEKSILIDDQDLAATENPIETRPAFDFIKASEPKRQTELCVRETRWTIENLAKLHQDLQTLHCTQRNRADTFYTSVLERIPRPPKLRDVPSVPLTQVTKENLYQAAILIQRIIHGRAIQSQMHQGRGRWKEMMEELRSTEAMTEQQLTAINNLKEHVNIDKRLSGVMKHIVGQTVGSTIGQTLELLAQELLRFRNEGIAHSQALEAECVRWKREVPETGRRQKEMRRREEHNLMYSQLLETYQQSINEFLDILVSRAKEHEAKVEAYDYAIEVARLKDIVEEEEEDTTPISSDLLFAFVAPDGLRELTRTCMLILGQKYEEARQRLVATGQAEPRTSSELRRLHFEDERESQVPSCGLLPPGSSIGDTSLFTSYTYTDELDMSESSDVYESGADTESMSTAPPPPSPIIARFGLVPPLSPEDRLLSRIMRDMCFIAGRLLHTAAKILNKALGMSNIPPEAFEEALHRTMLVINGAKEEIVRLIYPRSKSEEKVLPTKQATQEIIKEAAQIVDSILVKARERIEATKGKMTDRTLPRIVIESDVQERAKILVEEVIKEAQKNILRTVVEDFLSDLLKEASQRVDQISENTN